MYSSSSSSIKSSSSIINAITDVQNRSSKGSDMLQCSCALEQVLKEEITMLEAEILRLERHILSLYRAVFQDYYCNNYRRRVISNPTTCSPTTIRHLHDHDQLRRLRLGSVLSQGAQVAADRDESSSSSSSDQGNIVDEQRRIMLLHGGNFLHAVETRRPSSDSDYYDHHNHEQSCSSLDTETASSSLHSIPSKEMSSIADSAVRRSLAQHLNISRLPTNDHITTTPEELSRDILRCISSIYCRLARPSNYSTRHLEDVAFPSSPPPPAAAPSHSSSCLFTSGGPCGYNDIDAVVIRRKLQGMKDESMPYAAAAATAAAPASAMIEVFKICIDDDTSFHFATAMLKSFRSLVQRLEKADPSKMQREEQLAFWINIHNALIMHAHLACGTQKRVKYAAILKAAYNVGGRSINACVILSSIFGIRSHNSEPWLQTLFSPGRKSKTKGSLRHVYALEYPEPLVHFALCSGAYSDPAVRVYTAKNIFQELKLAKQEFVIRAAGMNLHNESRIFLPKILLYYANDMSLDLCGLVEAVVRCLPDEQKTMRMRKTWKSMTARKQQLHKYIHWLPQTSSFRYLIHADLAR